MDRRNFIRKSLEAAVAAMLAGYGWNRWNREPIEMHYSENGNLLRFRVHGTSAWDKPLQYRVQGYKNEAPIQSYGYPHITVDEITRLVLLGWEPREYGVAANAYDDEVVQLFKYIPFVCPDAQKCGFKADYVDQLVVSFQSEDKTRTMPKDILIDVTSSLLRDYEKEWRHNLVFGGTTVQEEIRRLLDMPEGTSKH